MLAHASDRAYIHLHCLKVALAAQSQLCWKTRPAGALACGGISSAPFAQCNHRDVQVQKAAEEETMERGWRQLSRVVLLQGL